jgi:hypothetical protein
MAELCRVNAYGQSLKKNKHWSMAFWSYSTVQVLVLDNLRGAVLVAKVWFSNMLTLSLFTICLANRLVLTLNKGGQGFNFYEY